MGILSFFNRNTAPVVEEQQPQKRTSSRRGQVRRFEAAAQHRTLYDWVVNLVNDFNQELESDLRALRSRSRDASINDVYARRIIKAHKQNVVGENGIQLKMAVRRQNGTPDEAANQYIEQAWNEYTKAVEVSGLSLHDCETLIVESVVRDGEIFVVFHKGKQFGEHGIQIRFLNADFLDENSKPHQLDNGNIIVSGIEYDELGRPVAYHFYRRHPSLVRGPIRSEDRYRVEARNVLHIFDRERTDQGRGFPWLSTALTQLTHLKEYQKSELVAARIASAKMGFYTRPKGENELGEGVDENDLDALVTEVDPGMFDVLPEGYGLETFDPQNPNGNFGTFQKSILRGVAASVGLSYHTVANDLESTSYSSLRQGAIEERDTYKCLQKWLITNFHQPLFERWLMVALEFGKGGLRLPAANFNKYNSPTWRPRTWSWIDPQKETQAIKLQLEKGLRSRSDVIRGLGGDFRDVMAEIAAENDYAKQLGIDLNAMNSNEVAPKENENGETEETPNEEV